MKLKKLILVGLFQLTFNSLKMKSVFCLRNYFPLKQKTFIQCCGKERGHSEFALTSGE